MLARVFLPPGGNIWNYKIIGLQSYKVAQANVQLHFAKICQDMGGLHTCQQDSNKMVQYSCKPRFNDMYSEYYM